MEKLLAKLPPHEGKPAEGGNPNVAALEEFLLTCFVGGLGGWGRGRAGSPERKRPWVQPFGDENH